MRNHQEFHSHLNHVLQLAPDAAAVYSGSTSYSWRQLADTIRAYDEVFATLNLPTGSQIGVIAHNKAATIAALLAITRAGHCFVTFNPMHSGKKIGQELEALRLPLLIAAADDINDDELAESVRRNANAVLVATDTTAGIKLHLDKGNSSSSFCDPLEGIAVMMQSSGTTGAPKRIPLKFAGLLHPVSDQMPTAGSSAVQIKGTPVIVANPLGHIGGLFHTLKAIIDARPQILMGRFDVQTWSAAVQRYQLKLGHLVPATVKMILDAQVPVEKLSSLKAIICGSAALRPDIQQSFEAMYGVPLLVVYGATEFAGGVAGWTLPLHREFMPTKLGSVGRAFPGSELRVVNADNGEELTRGEEGILEICSVQSTSGMAAWVATTDIAILDNEDFLWIRGRADTAINRGGFKILPSDVEKVLEDHVDVEEAVVVALDDDRLGQVPAAILLPAESINDIDLEAVESHARESLTAYQVPARFLVVASIPRNASLKPDLLAIRSLFERQIV
jgi:long-chain acyl-CoA synthetase